MSPSNWSLVDEPWLALRELLLSEGLTWSKAPFQKAAVNSVPTVPGIYLVCAMSLVPFVSLNPQPMNIIYVGQASNSIRERFNYHLSSNAKPKMKKARSIFGNNLVFCWTQSAKFAEIELMIYEAFGPPINDTSPPKLTAVLGPPRTIKLPAEDQQNNGRKNEALSSISLHHGWA